MKKILYFFLISCFSFTISSCAKKDGSSDTSTSFWPKQIGTSSNDYGTGVTVEFSDNIHVSGQSNGGLDGNINSLNDGIFLVKYNSSGTKLWTKQLGIFDNESGISMTVDSSDNIYVTGIASGGLDRNTSSGGEDIVLMKYNSSGIKQWRKQLGSSSSDFAWDVTVDSSDNIYVTGFINGSLDGQFNQESNYDIFLVKYNSDGVKQ